MNGMEYSELKGNYDDYSFGDLVLVFPNPDGELKGHGVTFRDAEKHFDEVLTVMTDEGVSKSQLKKERDSFLLAFLTLNDYVHHLTKEEEMVEQEAEALIKHKPKKKKRKKKDIPVPEENKY